MLVIRLPLIAPTVVPRRSREQLLIGFIAATELRYQRCSLLPAELHHCAAAAVDDEHSGLGDAVVERILVNAQRRHSPVGAPITVDLMSISLIRVDPEANDRRALIEFFTHNEFPFHAYARRRTAAEVSELIDSGAFDGEDRRSYWLDHDGLGRIGLIRLEDLCDDTPMFDLRLAESSRGRGLGAECLRAATDHLFTTLEADRFEGQTRADNLAMRSIFVRTGWTKEAHYRRAWPVEGREPQDTVVYAILREEWESGKVRGLQWHDRPQFAPENSSDVAFESNAVPTVDELTALYQSVGWSAYTRDPASLHVSVMASAHVVTALHDGEVVGLARVISDFGSIVYLQDVLVHPDHQRRGIGRLLVERVLCPFSEVRQTVLLTDADPALTAFYVSLGFHEVSGSLQSDVRAFMQN